MSLSSVSTNFITGIPADGPDFGWKLRRLPEKRIGAYTVMSVAVAAGCPVRPAGAGETEVILVALPLC
jgi:hypothetical protein